MIAITRRHLAFAIALLLAAAVALWSRLWGLDWPVAFDYDEGVYWQTFRAVASSRAIYSQVFYSQPPLFADLSMPIYLLFGSTLTAARLAVVVPSLVGLGAAFALGMAIAGRWGGLVVLLLTVTSPAYLLASRTLQADGPSAAAVIVVLALALWWWRSPKLALAIVCGLALATAVLIKLLAVVAFAPVAAVAVIALWEARRSRDVFVAVALQLASSAVAAALLIVAVLLVHAGAWSEMLVQVVSFHTDARGSFGQADLLRQLMANFEPLKRLFSVNLALSIVAFWGLMVGVATRNKAVLPVAAMLAGSVLLLLQVPVFTHHTIILVPSLVALAAFGFSPAARKWPCVVAICLLVICVAFDVARDTIYFGHGLNLARTEGQRLQPIIADLRAHSDPRDWIVSDDQMAVALADRDTPPRLVDTSMVRLRGGYLDGDTLCRAVASPRVKAVLLASRRLDTSARFIECLQSGSAFSHFRNYGKRVDLWMRR